jgi:hypothetical protein
MPDILLDKDKKWPVSEDSTISWTREKLFAYFDSVSNRKEKTIVLPSSSETFR